MDPSGFFRKNRTGFVVLMGRKEWIFESDYSACGCGDHDLCSDGTRNLQTGCAILLIFIGLGMLFGEDGIFRIVFDDYGVTETICSVSLIFIIFYGGFGTNVKEAKSVAAKAAAVVHTGAWH